MADINLQIPKRKVGYFNGSNACLTVPDHADFDVIADASDYTIDFFVKHDSPLNTEYYVYQTEDGSNRWGLYHRCSDYDAGVVFWAVSGGVPIIVTSDYQVTGKGLISDSNLHHVALCKVGTKYGVYLDGQQAGYVDDASVDTFAGALEIGGSAFLGAGYFKGYLGQVRVQKSNVFNANPNSGSTDTIQVPKQPPAVDSNTKLLLQFNPNITTDDGNTGHTVTNNNVTQDDLDLQFIDILIQEQATLLEIFNINVYESFLITEHSDIIDEVLEIGVVFDGILTNDNQGGSPTVLYPSVFESIAIEESVTIGNDLISFSGNDNITTSETIALGWDELSISVYADVSVSDYGDIWSFIQVFDDIGYQDIILDIYSPELPVSVYEDIAVVEAFIIPLEINIFEQFFITDYAEQTWGYRLIDLYDTVFYSEELTIEVANTIGVYEFFPVLEDVQLTLNRVFSRSTNVVVSEWVSVARDILYLTADEQVTIVEYKVVGREVEMVDTYTSVSVLEIAFAEITLDLSFNDFLRSYPFDEETLTNIIVEQFENGSEQRRDKWGRVKKRFAINFNPRSKDEIDALKAFYVSRRGPANAFDFISPLDGVDYLVRFEDNSLQISRVAFGIYRAQVTLVEVFR